MDIIEPPESTRALVDAFLETAYIAECDDGQVEIAIGHLAAQLEARVAGKCLGFITAWNPGAERLSDEENNAADRDLVHVIDSHRVERFPMHAVSPDGVWFEAGWLVSDVSRVTLDQWARRFGQLGTLWWQRGHAVKLRVYHPKIAHSDNVFIDWIE
ncbi:DUF3293 domain-containing protein [Lysobacter soyae]|uniref:DUF3293 domain-containing protein n=1 Tax=Lysobacter soyae TaxID=2764185 RepID=A0ABX8WMZ5_9GAMM|nr:DUF3293 domain-containing protein [Lysobacter sp. CJ11]QYR52191.1 DUF3293 domain-containing protein [Lysobacter sp. CJ11]